MTTVFQPYDMTNSEAELHAYAGQTVEKIGEPYYPDMDEDFQMHRIRFADGFEGAAFLDELTEREDA